MAELTNARCLAFFGSKPRQDVTLLDALTVAHLGFLCPEAEPAGAKINLRTEIINHVSAILPRHQEHRRRRWRHVVARRDVPGAELRNFHVECKVAKPITSGIYGIGIEYDVTINIWTSYGALSQEHDDSIITEDGNQIWIALDQSPDPEVRDLISTQYANWVDQDSTDGHRWGAHVLLARFIAPHLPT